MFTKSLVLRSLVVLSSVVAIAHNPVLADPTTDILGTNRSTAEVDQWMVKYLGFSDDWEAARSYTDGVLNDTGYVQAQAGGSNWVWISSAQYAIGFYSYVTIINDSSFTSGNSAISFSELSISNFSSDDWVAAIVINGVRYDAFTGNENRTTYQNEDILIPSGGNISWNVNGDNTVEIIIYNIIGPTWLSATIQASYAPVPEPETYAMLLAGLGIVGAVTRRQRIKAAK